MHCEALPIPVHPDTHPLCKIKSDIMTANHPLFQSLASIQLNGNVLSNEEVHHTAVGNPGITDVDSEKELSKVLPDAPRQITEDVLPKVPTMSLLEENAARAAVLEPVYKATFLSDNNMPDGQIIAPGAEFVKSWCMVNDGNTAWPAGTALVFIAGNRLAGLNDSPLRYKVGDVEPGAVVDVWAGDMKAPDEPGRYVSYWSLQDEEGCLFGHRVWCDIVVPELESGHASQVGSITLPTLNEHLESRGHVTDVPPSLPQSSSDITEPVTVSTQVSHSTGLDSRSSDEWEETTGLLLEAENPSQGVAITGSVPASVEWVILDDD